MDFTSHYHAFKGLTDRAHGNGWINADQLASLRTVELQQAESLFAEQPHRPLLIGLFGGTGVGKSSLLNRLAGESIARTGIERPTSHEVTLYLHQDFRITLLPDELPLEHTRIAYHNEDKRRLAAWLDMPDMDSTEPHNRELVEAWLPYLDWIIYVVSPERYHDDIGWRFLHQRGDRHAWLFVLNQWDQGRPEQLEDFRNRLKSEGFANPLLLRTSCTEDACEDDFALLEQTVNQAIQEHGVELLQRFGLVVRLNDLGRQLDRLTEMVGTEAQWTEAARQWRRTLSSQLKALRQGFGAQIKHQTKFIRSRKPTKESLPGLFDELVRSIWSTRQREQLKQLNNSLLDGLQSASLPTQPLYAGLEDLAVKSDELMHEANKTALHIALAKPGSWLHRSAHRLAGFLCWLLPLGAALWAIKHLVSTFYAGTHGWADFLGLDFAVHSLLMIGLAWLIPWLLHKKLKPGPGTIVKRGLSAGVRDGIIQLVRTYEALWRILTDEHKAMTEEIKQVQGRLAEPDSQSKIPLKNSAYKKNALAS